MVSRFGDTCRLTSMMVLVLLYFFVELITGHLTRSIALVADSFHMLSDFMSLVVALVATRIAKWPSSSKNTFGWQRAEVVGSLVNTVVLISLCFNILIDVAKRFIEPQKTDKPKLMVFVGAGGLLINAIGLLILSHHGHSHGHGYNVAEITVGIY
ncbi:unnamed protein product [Protopolystoma xenopodis]|uniref:Cation efflux protein transmembrane domain-containing protein n=1 Tax=Protopolystoma xenopodis TaxID=117903 RepID=A0A448X012_9PLAT|nr:unnamed protein product [Protopolystoma xenopodis]